MSFVAIHNNHGVPLTPERERRLQALAWEISELFGEKPFRIIIMPNFGRPGSPYSVIVKFDRGSDRD